MNDQQTQPLAEHETDLQPGFLASGRHPLSVGYLVMGVAFAGLLLVWALIVGHVVEGDDIRWLMPVPWVLAGVAGLIGLITAERRRAGAQRRQWAEASAQPTDTTGPDIMEP
ncbi:hypothetical protein [Nocardioides sp. GXZ039]|uniref:hypothetical protein n=1 Tax=Nocardioides sp. GXZ039 TaxID=3136018 RepID=UPI0030F49BC5